MTSAQKERILEIIQADAETRGRLCDSKGRMCIMGGLAHAAGESKAALQVFLSLQVFGLVGSTYGLTEEKMLSLIGVNDTHSVRRERQRALKLKVKSWVATDAE